LNVLPKSSCARIAGTIIPNATVFEKWQDL
jgi:hypothetical protein